MNKRISIVLAVAAIMITAGCTGLIPSGDDDALNGFNEDGMNTSAAMASHQSALTDAETWSTSIRNAQESDTYVDNSTEATRVNHNTSTVIRDIQFGPSRGLTSYVTESERFSEVRSSNTSFYEYVESGYDINESTVSSRLSFYIDNLNYTLESDRADTLRYQADERTQDSIFNERGPDNASVEDISSTLVVNEQGYISEFEFIGTTVSENRTDVELRLSIQFSDVGATTVSEPVWVSEAQNVTVR